MLFCIPWQLRIAEDVVVEDENQVPNGRFQGGVASGGQAAIWLAHKSKSASRLKALQHFQGAVGRAVDDNDFKLIGWKFLREDR